MSAADLAAIDRRRRDHNQLGFALQLCALRYPGRLLRPGELIPVTALLVVAEQIGVAPEALSDYATRFQTRYQQLGSYSFSARMTFRRSNTSSSSNHGFFTSHGWLRGDECASGR